jgi:hypothetical protein
MAIVDDNEFPKLIIRESANDGSDFSNPSADHRVLFLGEDGDLHLRDSSGTVTTPNDTGGGGDPTHSFLGYNTVGGSAETMTQYRWYAKRITAATDGILLSLGAYIKWGADDLGAIMAAVYEDAAGPVPNKALFATSIGTGSDTVDLSEAAGTRNPRWFSLPCGLFVTADDYWIAFATRNNSTQADIYYDTSGSDRYWTPGGFRILDGAYLSQTDSTRNYSIRASFIATA